MKNNTFIYLLTVLFLNACNQSESIPDPRPKAQIQFLHKVADLASEMKMVGNEIVVDDRLDSCRKAISRYVKDTLNNKFDNWVLRVEDINNRPMGFDIVELTLLTHVDFNLDSKYPQSDSNVFKSYIHYDKKSAIDSLKNIVKGDLVKVSGTFDLKNKLLELAVNSTSYSETALFENPKFSFTLKSISKSKK